MWGGGGGGGGCSFLTVQSSKIGASNKSKNSDIREHGS